MALAARQSSQRQALVRRGFRTKKEAEAALHEAERRVRSGRLIDAGRITFGDYLVARWLPAIAADTKLKPTSVAGYRSMSRHLVASLGAVRLDQLTGDQLTTLYGIFCWAEGTTLHPNVITGTYRRIVDQAGLPPLPLHNLRHAWATNALDNGVDVKDVATRLGHSSTRITHDIYVAPLPERDARAAALVASSTTVRARSAELV